MNINEKLNLLKNLYNLNLRFQRKLRICQEDSLLSAAFLNEEQASDEDTDPLILNN